MFLHFGVFKYWDIGCVIIKSDKGRYGAYSKQFVYFLTACPVQGAP